MALTPLSGGATTTAKVGDVNALIAALNEELDAARARLAALENAASPTGDQFAEVATAVIALKVKPDPVIPPDLTDRVEALEHLVVRAPAQDPVPGQPAAPLLARPAGLDPNKVETVFDLVTFYYRDLELYARRIDSRKWRLYATLNYVVVSPAVWTYDEIVEGTPEEVYERAMTRLQELAELKPQHDAVHERVARMSEGSA